MNENMENIPEIFKMEKLEITSINMFYMFIEYEFNKPIRKLGLKSFDIKAKVELGNSVKEYHCPKTLWEDIKQFQPYTKGTLTLYIGGHTGDSDYEYDENWIEDLTNPRFEFVYEFETKFFRVCDTKKIKVVSEDLPVSNRLTDHRRIASAIRSAIDRTDKKIYFEKIHYSFSSLNSSYVSRKRMDISQTSHAWTWGPDVFFINDVCFIMNPGKYRVSNENIKATAVESKKIIKFFENGLGGFSLPVPSFLTENPVIYAVTYDPYIGHNGIEPLFRDRELCFDGKEFSIQENTEDFSIEEIANMYRKYPGCRHIDAIGGHGEKLLGVGERLLDNTDGIKIVLYDDFNVLFRTDKEIPGAEFVIDNMYILSKSEFVNLEEVNHG